jgi:hypothetical protein
MPRSAALRGWRVVSDASVADAAGADRISACDRRAGSGVTRLIKRPQKEMDRTSSPFLLPPQHQSVPHPTIGSVSLPLREHSTGEAQSAAKWLTRVSVLALAYRVCRVLSRAGRVLRRPAGVARRSVCGWGYCFCCFVAPNCLVRVCSARYRLPPPGIPAGPLNAV